MQNTNNRNEIVDFLKGISIILVVAGHSITNIIAMNHVQNFIYSFHMPLFFFLSAYIEEKNCCKYKENKVNMIKKRSISLLLPYFSWTIILFFIGNEFSLSNIPELLFRLSGYHQDGLWFLAVMWGLKCMHFAFWHLQQKIIANSQGVKRLLLNVIILIILELLLLCIAIVTRHPFSINMISYAIPYFFAVLIVDDSKLQTLIANPFVITLSFVCYAIIFPHFSFYNTAQITQVLRILLSLCIIIIIYNTNFSFPSRMQACLRIFGQNSLEIYLLHSFFMDYKSSFLLFNSTFLLTTYVLIITIAVCFLCIIIAHLLGTSSHLKKILFGK